MHEVLERPGRSASQDRHELTAAILLNPLHSSLQQPACRVGVPSFRVLLMMPSMTLKLLARTRQADSITGGKLLDLCR